LAVNTTTALGDYASVRGFITVLLQPNSCDWQTFQHFDTMVNGLEMLLTYLNNLPNGTVVCGVTCDTPVLYNAPSPYIIQAFLGFGMNVTQLVFRTKMTFVSTIGQPQLIQYNISANPSYNLLMNATVNTQGLYSPTTILQVNFVKFNVNIHDP